MSSTTTSPAVTQYGIFFDQSRCTGCYGCAAACKAKNNTPAGAVRWLRLFNWETGNFPDVTMSTLFAPCYHCVNPVCVTAAGDGSLIKEPKYGAVLIDPAKSTSPALFAANQACPYGAILFDSSGNASKCNMCVDRLETGLLPACVLACPNRALDFGRLSDMQAKYGKNSDLPNVPSSSTTTPAIVFKARTPRKQVVPYDSAAALLLLANRGSLPAVFTSPTAVIPTVVVGRSKLNMHAQGADLITATQNND